MRGTVLESDDLDADVAALTARGVNIDGGIEEQPWGRFARRFRSIWRYCSGRTWSSSSGWAGNAVTVTASRSDSGFSAP
jgi:hypothetical protein